MNQPKVKYSLSNWDLVTVNPNYKTWDWKDLFCFWGVNVQSIIGFSLIASLYTIHSLNTFVVFLSRLVGHIVDRVILKNNQGHGIGYFITVMISQIILEKILSVL